MITSSSEVFVCGYGQLLRYFDSGMFSLKCCHVSSSASFLAYSCRLMELLSIFRGTCFSISMKHRNRSFKYQSSHEQNHWKIGLHNASSEICNAVVGFCIELLKFSYLPGYRGFPELPAVNWITQNTYQKLNYQASC